LKASLRAQGEVRLEAEGTRSPGEGGVELLMGDGQAELTARALGDLSFAEASASDPSDLAGAITAQVEAALYEAEAELDAEMGPDSQRASEVGERVRRALDRALRREREEAIPAAEAPELEQEREMVLHMLAEHRITVDQAEALFRAMESNE
jgi:hypothetical protein